MEAVVPSLASKLDALHAKVGKKLRIATKAGDVQEADRQNLRAQIEAAIAELEFSAYADLIYDDATALIEVAWENAKHLLDISTGFDVVPERTLKKLRDRINDLTFLVQEREQEALRTTLDQGFSEGLSGKEVADRISSMFAEGYHRLNDKGDVILVAPTKAWSEMVARTEMATAATAGAHSLYVEARIKTIRIQESDPCDFCAQWDDEVFPIDEVPDGGPPWHPRCNCVETPGDDDLGSWRGTDEERSNAQSGNNSK